MGALGIAIVAIITFIICVILQVLLYKISFKTFRNIFEEINANKMILMSFLIVYLLPQVFGFLVDIIRKIIDIWGILSLLFYLSPNIICFIVLFYYLWKNLILKNQEDKKLKVVIVSCLAFLPYILMIVVGLTVLYAILDINLLEMLSNTF